MSLVFLTAIFLADQWTALLMKSQDFPLPEAKISKTNGNWDLVDIMSRLTYIWKFNTILYT